MKQKLLRELPFLARWLTIFLLAGWAKNASGQTTYNYVVTRTPQVEGKLTEADLAGLTRSELLQTTTYSDGLGRTIQQVGKEISPAGKDVVLPLEYDAMGRMSTAYLPYEATTGTGLYHADALASSSTAGQQGLFYARPGDKIADDAAPFARTVYENSPLGRTLEQGATGSAWQPGGAASHTKHAEYRSNYASEDIKRFRYDYGSNQPVCTGSYAESSLAVTVTRDEHDAYTYEYTDAWGRVVTKTTQINRYQYLYIYYVYDDFGNLRFAIQPKGVDALIPLDDWNEGLTSAFLFKYCFAYVYDTRNRLVEKHVPGGDTFYMAYNSQNQLVGTLAGKDIVHDNFCWQIVKYDALARPVLTARITLPYNRDDLQYELDRQPSTAVLFESRDNTSSLGYTLTQSYPAATLDDVQTLTYYDDYDYPGITAIAFSAENGVTTYFSRLQGMATGHAERVVGTAQWATTKTFYDDRQQPIQTWATQPSGSTRSTAKLDFLGRPTATLLTMSWGATSHSLRNVFSYDHAGRLLDVFQQMEYGLVATPPQLVLVAHHEYNELGQLVDKKLHSIDNGATSLQSVDYRYNIRGWLTQVNDRDLLVNADGPDVEPDLFGFELKYNEGLHLSVSGSLPQYNGNIAEMLWRSHNPNTPHILRGYAYHYDLANRLTSADYLTYESAGAGFAWGQTSSNYSVSNITYDANGNLLTMERKGLLTTVGASNPLYGDLDKLRYTYAGSSNQLTGVQDQTAPTVPTHDFEDNGNGNQNDYAYDAAGDLISDTNKGITNIAYNHLNLPQDIYFTGGRTIRFTYTAGGQKLSKSVEAPGLPTKLTSYIGGFVLENNVLSFGPMPEGRVLFTPGTSSPNFAWKYEYHIKDHLGNLRFAFRDAGGTTAQRSTAGMEPVNAPTEESKFERIAETRLRDAAHARSGDYVARLSAASGTGQGPRITVPVQAGDSIKAEVYGRYDRSQSIGSVLRAVALTAGAASVAGPLGPATETPMPVARHRWWPTLGLAITPGLLLARAAKKQVSDALPQAYLRYQLFTRDSQLVATRRAPLQRTSHDEWQLLKIDLKADSTGYVVASLENASAQPAYFDDLQLRTVDPVKMQENHYDPFGLNLAGIEADGDPTSKFQFGGKEKQDEFGLNWNDHGARMYDPQLGRWHVADPLADVAPYSSPFAAFNNNPISNTDPTGMEAEGWFRDFNNANAITYRSDINSQADLDRVGRAGSYIGSDIQMTFSDGSSMHGGVDGHLSMTTGEATVIGHSSSGQIMASALVAGGRAASLDGPEIGPADLIGAGMVLGGGAMVAIHSLHITVPLSITDDKSVETVNIYKAPQPGMAKKLLMNGFQPKDFPLDAGLGLNGQAYFAAPDSKFLAEYWAKQYSDTIIQVTMPKSIYNDVFRPYNPALQTGERRYLGPPGGNEVSIPNTLFPVLNTFPRSISK